MKQKDNTIKLSQNQKNVLYYMQKGNSLNIADVHPKVLGSLISRKLISAEDGSPFNYILTELGKSIELL